MKGQIQQLIKKMDALSMRERVLVFIAVLALIIGPWDGLFMVPLTLQAEREAAEIIDLEKRIKKLDMQISLLQKKAKEDPGKAVRGNLKLYGRELDGLDQEIATLAKQLISPKKMAQVLQQMLMQIPGLNIIKVKSLDVQPLIDDSDSKKKRKGKQMPAVPALGIYHHRIVIEFEGGFQQTVEYLKMLEAMPWEIYWDHIEYSVEEYPKAHVSIGVSTLSLHEGWIGV